jgi:hypothetical protein
MRRAAIFVSVATVTAVMASPALAAASPWVPAPVNTQVAIAKAVNRDATNQGGDAHSPGCFNVLLVKKNRNLAAVSLPPRANVAACGSPATFGYQVFARVSGVWVRVGGTSGPPGSRCTWTKKATAAHKSQMKVAGLCA